MSYVQRLVVLLAVVAAGVLAPSCSRNETNGSGEKQTEVRQVTDANGSETRPVVVIETSMGTIKAELWDHKAPNTVANFLTYVDDRFYDGLIFHRVMPKFMIQGGGFTPEMKEKPTRPPIKNEAAFGVLNNRGTLAMARMNDPHSATAQFYINLVANEALNFRTRERGRGGYGYCVFGRVIEGMIVVDRIGQVQTTTRGRYENVPAEPVVIKSIRRAD